MGDFQSPPFIHDPSPRTALCTMASPCNITSIPSCCGSLVVHPSVPERPTGCTRHLTMSMTMLPMLPDACWDRALEYRGWKRNGKETIGRGLALDRVGTVPDLGSAGPPKFQRSSC